MEQLGKILIVDDNEDVLFALNLLLEPYTEKIKVATTPDRIEYFMTTFGPDIILLDMNFSRDAISGQEGFESLEQILKIDPQAIVIFMTAYADTDKAVRAIKAGATDFIPKPWEKEKLLATLSSGMKLRQSRHEVNMLKEQVEVLSGQGGPENEIIGESEAMQEVFSTINKLSETDANILILGNSGQGKSYLLKLLLTNLRESGMHICALDPEMEYEDLTNNLGGCFIDLMSGEFIINPLEPKTWDEAGSPEDLDAPQTFRIRSRLSQHISFLKDFFRSYKDFSDREIDVIEIMLQKLYTRWGITDESDFECLAAEDYPVLSDLYAFIEEEYQGFDENRRQLYTAEMIQSILLGLNSMCVGAESKFFNGHTNITDDGFITFGVKGLLQASRSLKNALLFNVLSFMSDVLLTQGNTAASLDEFYLFLSNLTAVEYVRNFMKRVRKKDSAVIIASQNLEDFNLDGVREYTKPLFSIPTHQFLFNAGSIDAKFYTDTLQLEDSEYNLIRYPQRGVCLYKCGNERYNLMVNAPEHKARLFGKAGGR